MSQCFFKQTKFTISKPSQLPSRVEKIQDLLGMRGKLRRLDRNMAVNLKFGSKIKFIMKIMGSNSTTHSKYKQKQSFKQLGFFYLARLRHAVVACFFQQNLYRYDFIVNYCLPIFLFNFLAPSRFGIFAASLV